MCLVVVMIVVVISRSATDAHIDETPMNTNQHETRDWLGVRDGVRV